MGFEVLYKYHEKKESGIGYNMKEQLEMKKRVGKSYDDTSYQKLAVAIMGQLARRDIMVVDVDIVEFVKKEINFREAKNGIVIKNKKYLFNDTDTELEEVDEEYCDPNVNYALANQKKEVVPQNVDPQPAPNTNVVPKPPPVNVQQNKKLKPLRYEFFEPHPDLMADLKKRNLKFTVGQKYPIYEEKQDMRGIMFGMLYSTVDDEGNKQILTDKLFTFRATLEGGSQFINNNDIPLDYGKTIPSDVPVLR